MPLNVVFSFGSHLMCKNSYLCAGDNSTFVSPSLDNTYLQVERRGNTTIKILKVLMLTFEIHTVSLT